ncbi:MAG: hypothetical protein AAGE79_01720 [Acinetobacter pittii]
MSQKDLVRFPARLQPDIHEDLVVYAQQQDTSINTAINSLLKFALKYGLKGKNQYLDKCIPEQKDNLQKVSYFVDKGILDITVEEINKNNSQIYLKLIETQFETLKDEDRKLLSDVAYALASRDK